MAEFKQNEIYFGFRLQKIEEINDIHSTAYLFSHEKSGARLLYLKNADHNKVFNVVFKTPPENDCGTPHILEHSVLCGLRKYEAKDPFNELAKGSLNTFLNAMTFPDKTVYPFATPNETDFRNLMDVYLNAVFCPLAMVDRAVFEQEGWHRDADGTVSGVVYNEMQGALATPDAQLQNALERAMFPDTAYGFVSGGDPESIPALTYEKYQRVYRRHYSADNCCITLYGNMDMAEKLEMLDRDYLSRMPRTTTRPRLTVQDEQPGTCVELPYYTAQYLNLWMQAEDDTILISPRNLNSGVKLNWTTHEIVWILANPEVFKGTKYEKYVLTPDSDFLWHYRQHTVYQIDTDLDGNPDTVEITMFDNHRNPEADYYDHEKGSFVTVYAVNEKEKTVSKNRLVWLREPDLNQRPSGYEPDELPDCSTPRYLLCALSGSR